LKARRSAATRSACLNALLYRDEVVSEIDIEGVAWYRGVTPAS
jgi:hypothetical protein